MNCDNDFDVLSLDNCQPRTHIVIPKTIVKDIPIRNSCIVLQKVFLERFLLMGQLSRELSFGALLTPGKVKTHLQTCNDILNYNAMQCKSHLLLSNPKYAAHRWNNKGATFYSAACPDPAEASPIKRLAQYRGWSLGQQHVISLKVLPQCHLSK